MRTLIHRICRAVPVRKAGPFLKALLFWSAAFHPLLDSAYQLDCRLLADVIFGRTSSALSLNVPLLKYEMLPLEKRGSARGRAH